MIYIVTLEKVIQYYTAISVEADSLVEAKDLALDKVLELKWNSDGDASFQMIHIMHKNIDYPEPLNPEDDCYS